MPQMPPERFPSPNWFAHMPAPTGVPDQPALVVEHRAQEHDDAQHVHQQIFDQHGLVAWIPHRVFADPDLILLRDSDIDLGDLLGRLPPTTVATHTTIEYAQRRTSLFGIEPVTRPGLQDQTSGTIDLGVEALNTPFGDVQAAVRLNPDGTQRTIPITQADPQILIIGDWADLVEWTCSDTRLGYLFGSNRIRTDGHLTLLSYIEGHISWPKAPHDQLWAAQFHQALSTYTTHRNSPQYQHLMDSIEESDARLNSS